MQMARARLLLVYWMHDMILKLYITKMYDILKEGKKIEFSILPTTRAIYEFCVHLKLEMHNSIRDVPCQQARVGLVL